MTSPPPTDNSAHIHAVAWRVGIVAFAAASALLAATLAPRSAHALTRPRIDTAQVRRKTRTLRVVGHAPTVSTPTAVHSTPTAVHSTPTAPVASGADYAPGKIVVAFDSTSSPAATIASVGAVATHGEDPIDSTGRVLALRRGVTVAEALARLRHRRGVAWAVPDYIATDAGGAPHGTAVAKQTILAEPLTDEADADMFIPDDPGRGGAPGDWAQLQWNFVGTFGVNAPEAWWNLNADGRPGGQGVIVAVLDTGVAYANRGRFLRSPDFDRYQFVAGHDFIDHSPYALDRNGHGTDVASTIAEETDNGYGLTGLAYGVRIMPVRVLNTEGDGEASQIARGVIFAVKHHAQVINLSLEFSSNITAADIPELISALAYAHRHGVVIVAAAGNEGSTDVPYPARDRYAISVGATTEHGCLATYSNYGHHVTLVAPGGGPDATIPGDPNCYPDKPSGRDIYQVTFSGSSPRKFGIPSGYEGTSMATPHVSATAALIIASGVLGPHPTPAQITARLTATATPLGDSSDRYYYGAGLVNAAAATAPGGPGAVTTAG